MFRNRSWAFLKAAVTALKSFVELVRQFLPSRFQNRRFLLDQYHFDLTSFEGDVSEWLSKFPITNQNVEIYFALAELFRRRGEFDKAVSVHEAIAAASIEGHSLAELQLEIAQDYYAAGVLGHAEDVLVKALEGADEEISKQSFRLWLSILEHEQDWERAVELVEQYGLTGSGGLRLANLYCEYASELSKNQPLAEVQKVLKKARKIEVGSRASLMSAELSTAQSKVSDAIQYYRELLMKDPKRVNLGLMPLKQLSQLDSSQIQLVRFLKNLYKIHPSARILEVIIELNGELGIKGSDESDKQWQSSIETHVRSGVSSAISIYWMRHLVDVPSHVVKSLFPAFEKHSLSETDTQICTECGFYSDQMVWQCPQCDAWETVYSQYELKISQQTNHGS